MKKLVVGITAPSSVILLKGQLRYFREKGYQCYLLAPEDERTIKFSKIEDCILLPVDIKREISISNDIKALKTIIGHFRKIKPDIVNVGTPKMGLLGGIAGKVTGVKKRIYTCRGYRFEHEKGGKRKLLLLMERIASASAHHILCISESVRNLGLKEKIFTKEKSSVINKGSSNGIDLNRFNPKLVLKKDILDLKENLELKDAFVFGFVGRLIDRKGIGELYQAFDIFNKRFPNSKLLMVGPVEENQIHNTSILELYNNHPQIIMAGKQLDVPLYLSTMDCFVLPAWWEGFGNVLVQAAAMGLPVISTTGTGSRDAVSNNYNGILVPPKSIEAVIEAMEKIYLNSDLRNTLGANGITWAKNFKSELIWEGMENLYKERI